MSRKRQSRKTHPDSPPQSSPQQSSPQQSSPPGGDAPSRAADRRSSKRSTLAAALAAGLALLVAGLVAWWTWPPTTHDDGRPEVTDPRLTYATDYLNVRPEVKYVGDQSCAACHEPECSSYERHPMRRTLQPLSKADAIEDLGAAAANPFRQDEFSYEVRREQGGGMVHRETHAGLGPDVVASREMKYAVGAGNHARSYLFEEDGHLFYSPVTWYSQQHQWGLSPAFLRVNRHFSMGTGSECLFCHTSRVEQTGPAVNQVRITEHGVGCERCHGPAELHVGRHEQAEGYSGQDFTIVNPAKLAPALRDAVCEQCHLEGSSNTRIARRGRDWFDYRPGLPLHLFIATFARAAHAGGDVEFVGHVEQMRASRCYRASEGKLSCISCHDPHARPEPAAKVEFYRQRCLACHGSGATECREPLERRRAKTALDDCTVCHMPARAASGLAHVAITDHRVPRIADKLELPQAAGTAHDDSTILVDLHQHLLGADDPEARRDMAIALSRFADDPRFPEAAQHALPLLQAAVQRDNADRLAWESLGRALWRLSRNEEADVALRKAIALAPDSEMAFVYAGYAAKAAGRVDDCVKYWREANRINPRDADYRFLFGDAYFRSGAWREAVEQFDRAIKKHPFHQTARLLAGRARVELKEWPAAEEDYRIVLKLDPKNAGARLGLAELHSRQGDYRAAVPWLRQVLADQPNQRDARLKLIDCYNRLGDARSAAEEAKRLTSGP